MSGLVRGVLRVVLGVIFGFGAWFWMTPSVSAEADWGVARIKEVSEAPSSFCIGQKQLVAIENGPVVQGCVSGERTQIATYYHEGSMRVAMKKWADAHFYPLQGVCGAQLACYYAESFDALVTQVYGPNGVRFTVVYQHYLRQIVWRDGAYVFAANSEPYAVGPAEHPVASGALAASQNGRWLAVELIDTGTALVDLFTLETRRITDRAYRYGFGMDPQSEMAVSNDGRSVVVTGSNNGFALFAVGNDCGEKMTWPLQATIVPPGRACPYTDMAIGSIVQGFYYGWRPIFHPTLPQLTVRVAKYYGESQLVTFTKGLDAVVPMGYMGLGDSFSSGEGETSADFYLPLTNADTERCHTSRRSYPFLIGGIQKVEARNIACSGAKMADIIGLGEYSGQKQRLKGKENTETLQQEARVSIVPGRVRQSEFLTLYQPDIVSIGIGGNDSGIMDKLRVCAMPGQCDWVGSHRRKEAAAEIDALETGYEAMFRSMQDELPLGKIIAIGYPDPIAPAGECDAITDALFTLEEREFLHRSIIRLNRVMKRAAERRGIQYVDIEDVFSGHKLCQSSAAMNGIRLGTASELMGSLQSFRLVKAESYHPTPFGHALIAQRVIEVLSRVGPGGGPVCDETCVGNDGYWGDATTGSSNISRQYELTDEPCERTCRIAIEPGVFQEGSEITVSLNDEALSVGGRPSSDGGFVSTVTASRSGIMTLRVAGRTEAGADLELYQAVEWGSVLSRPTLNVEKAVVSAHSGVTSALTPSSALSNSARTGTEPAAAIKGDAILLPTQVTARGNETKRIVPIPLLFTLIYGLIGIMAVWLISALLLRK